MITADVFSTVQDPDTNLPQALVTIHGWSGLAIFDTGATKSIMALRLFNKISHHSGNKIKNISAQIKLPNSEYIECTQLITVPVVLAGRVHRQSFLVVPKLACNLILGNDYLVAAGVVPINIHNGYTFSDLLPEDVPIKPYDVQINASCKLYTLTTKCTAPSLSPQQEICFSQGELRDDLSPEQKHTLMSTLLSYRDTITDQWIGYADVHMHTIDTGDATPIKQAPYPAKPPRQKVIDDHINQLLADDVIEPNVLYYETKQGIKPYIPRELRLGIINTYHDLPTAGHLGIAKTLRRVKSVVFWPKMTQDVAQYVRSCDICQRTKPTNQRPSGLMIPRHEGGVMEQINIDFTGPLPRFGPPKSILSDNATQFRSKIVQELLQKWNVKQTFTTPFHPSSNLAERVNRNLKAMLRAYCREDHTHWDENLDLMAYALNSAVSDTTSFTPAELFLGRELRSVMENGILGTTGLSYETYEEARDNTQAALDKIHNFVDKFEQEHREQQARYCNQGRRDVTYNPGELVVVRAHPISSAEKKLAAKLCDLWCGPYEVITMFNNVNVKLRDMKPHHKVIHRHVIEVQPYVQRDEHTLCERKDLNSESQNDHVLLPLADTQPNLHLGTPQPGVEFHPSDDELSNFSDGSSVDNQLRKLRPREKLIRPDTYQA
ncbi:hypothetical protein B566_EDAN016945 [Ephemera danica]|nr:hypothetical protein B566_EDAN016945 [Ephemera danica]